MIKYGLKFVVLNLKYGNKMKWWGLWVCHTEWQANAMVKYMKKEYGVDTIIKKCLIWEIIFQTSCRVKTDKLRFID